MLAFIRHYAARIWVTALVGGLGSIWLAPYLQPRLGLEWNPGLAALILALTFAGSGWIAKRWALSAVGRLVREASACERDGLHFEAEEMFRRALAIFDSCLISPFAKRKKSAGLSARLARFYLARRDKSSDSELFLESYLNFRPGDEEVAQEWLQQLDKRGGLREKHQDLAQGIGEALPHNYDIQCVLARFYLLLERTDFVALQTYRRVSNGKDQVPPAIAAQLARLFLKQKRADDWALKIYLQVLENDGDHRQLMRAVAACVRWIPETGHNRSQLQKARTHLADFTAAQLRQMSAGFNPPAPAPTPSRGRPGPALGIRLARGINQAAGRFLDATAAVAAGITMRSGTLARRWRRSAKMRRVLSGALLAGLSAGIVILVISTLGHLLKSEQGARRKAKPAAVVVTDPFTLQVAAYLKPDYARQYMARLKEQGLDAYWRKAVSGSKQWYQVRVSHFADKASARKYGRSLKSRGIIDDFYVANYQRP